MPKGKPLSKAHRKAISIGLMRFHKTGGKGPSTKGRADVKEAMAQFRASGLKGNPAFTKLSHVKDYVRGARRAISKRT